MRDEQEIEVLMKRSYALRNRINELEEEFEKIQEVLKEMRQ